MDGAPRLGACPEPAGERLVPPCLVVLCATEGFSGSSFAF
ncbi:hypothetical protein SAMN05421810_104116 [Amycolatopsis arida]|uniref:Uncharacterized protein n=1 Tax=Amycolatopsis arida TaxID=587909 RepID=A0A1I5UUB8_9PSEU|nr:hypothetical protein CLV69_106115 [Amycolatopsis arida]SFP98799.1 hypothetical protein SAMN05421810_104116 [Amycolatopsis arida]